MPSKANILKLIKKQESLEEMAQRSYEKLIDLVEDEEIRGQLQKIEEDEKKHVQLVESAVSILKR